MMLDEVHVRREKLEKLRTAGIDPYPRGVEKGDDCASLLEPFEEGRSVVTSGRLMTIRIHGAMMFADLVDETGKIQIAFKQEEVDPHAFDSFRDFVDPGDIVQVRGTLFLTKRGEKSIQVKTWIMLSKALLPLPEKWHGLKDVEARYRHRELDLLSNQDVRERFIIRSKLVSALRHFLDERGFFEVETPMLHPIPGGATARPFKTHHNALNIDLYLRVAPELYLKRLLVGGFEKIYEIGRCFRNEGIDYAHNPEFTMIELYWAYAGKDRFLSFLEEMITNMLERTLGTLSVKHEQGDLHFAGPWPQITFTQAIIDACGIDIDQTKTPTELIQAVKEKKIKIDFEQCVGIGEYYDELYKKTARPKLAGPLWVLDYPADIKPLANTNPDDPTKSSTAQLVIHGAEVVNAFYYELNDPFVQRQRLEEQEQLAAKGSEEAQHMDEEFLEALEHGMPPAGGMGMGIDRLAALLTGSPNLKEVILFPTLRPKESGQESL